MQNQYSRYRFLVMLHNFMKIYWVEFHEGVGCLKIRQKHQDNFYATIFLKCVGGASLMVPVLEYEKQFQISKASLNILQWHCFEYGMPYQTFLVWIYFTLIVMKSVITPLEGSMSVHRIFSITIRRHKKEQKQPSPYRQQHHNEAFENHVHPLACQICFHQK